MAVNILSGPIGAGKTTVARELLALLAAPVSYTEGDIFWSFIANAGNRERRENFGMIMLAMTAAAIPFARSGYEVLLDFSIPPEFLLTARKILKEVPLNYIVLRPSLSVCEARASTRRDGKILNYASNRSFYALFEIPSAHIICDDDADACTVAKRIWKGLAAGEFCVS